MTVAGWIVVLLWGIGGFFLAVAAGVLEKREQADRAHRYRDDSPGLLMLAVWIFAPLVAAAAAFVGVIWLFERIVDAADQKTPLTRDQMQRQIAQLEHELELDR